MSDKKSLEELLSTEEGCKYIAEHMFNPVKICARVMNKERNTAVREANPKWSEESLRPYLKPELHEDPYYAEMELQYLLYVLEVAEKYAHNVPELGEAAKMYRQIETITRQTPSKKGH
jgi:hypothetical protein